MLTDRFDDALSYASALHRGHMRKDGPIPYISHLLSVCALTLEYGGDEDQAIAALLHDAVEDRGGMKTAGEIAARYGTRVRDCVLACSDSSAEGSKAPWRARKEAYIADVPHKSADALLVTTADKVHNSRQIIADLEDIGEALWPKFKGGRDGTLWYYRALADAFPGRLSDRLNRNVARMEQLAAELEESAVSSAG